MNHTFLITKIYILILIGSFLTIIGLAFYKMVKSKLPDWEKVYWGIAFVILNVIAAIPFIIFHDYFLEKEKRSN